MATETEITTIVEYYSNLLIVQYHNKPNAVAMIELFVRELLANGVIFDVRDGFNVDTAVGVQLDTIGKYVYLDRFYQYLGLEGYFSFAVYSELPTPSVDKIGFATYADVDKTGLTLTYADILNQFLALSNTDFRRLIKLRIIQNNSNHSHKSIDDAIFSFFGDEITVAQTGTMEITYSVPQDLKAFTEVAIQKDILPRPMGVKLNYVIV